MVAEAAYTASMIAKSQQLIHDRDQWATVRVKPSGVRFTVMPGSSGRVHRVTLDSCDCKSFEFRRACSHVCALREAANHDALSTWITEIAAHSTAALADGWSPIPSDELAEHDAFRARLAAEPMPKARRGYADLFPSDDLDDVLTSAF